MIPTSIQQAAIDARGNVLVAAGAGTGKTSTLVQRCMALLEAGGSLENILMVTFTEAAATEMRGRLAAELHGKWQMATGKGSGKSAGQMADGKGSGPGQMANGKRSGEQARAEHFERQVALLDTALISTLHGFCLQLVREHFDELGIDPDVCVLDDSQTRPLIQQLLDALFENHYAGNAPKDRAVQQLVRVQGRGSEEDIRGLVLKLHRYSQSLDSPGRWIEKQRALFSAIEPAPWREWFVEGVLAVRKLWMPILTSHCGNAAVKGAIDVLNSLGQAATFAQAAEAVQKIQAADADDENWPRGSKKHVRAHLESFFSEMEFLACLAPNETSDPLAEDWALAREHMLTLLDLTVEFTARFDAEKRELGGVDFADIEQLALRVLVDAQTGQATAAARQWRERLEHVFVDEYQDINGAQDAILTALSREGMEANRFLVGDVKQSIYRFRLADPTIFRAYDERWSRNSTEATRLPLVENFRSRQGILDFVNSLFAILMRGSVGGIAYEPLVFGNTPGRGVLATREGEPRVEFHLIVKSDSADNSNGEPTEEETEVGDLLATEREARLAGLQLRRLKDEGHQIWDKDEQRLRPVCWSDMAVLLRSPASRVEGFAKEFARLGIPVEAPRAGFFESTEISDLVSLLKLLDNPLQDVPLLAVLHSPLVGLSLAELGEIRAIERADARSRFFWMAARQYQHKGPRTAEGWRKLNGFFTQFENWRELARQGSLSDCLETALEETTYELLLRARDRGEQQWANVRRFLDLAREYDPYQRQGLFRFLRFIDAQEDAAVEPEPPVVARDAVRLASIHKSKGLEFPVVVLAGMGCQFNFRDLQGSILLDERYGLCPRIAPADSEQQYPSLPYWLARQRQRSEILGEELRLLYVAMTRARDTLILTASSGKKGAGEWAAKTELPTDRELLSARCYLDWLSLWLPIASSEGNWTSDRDGASKLLSWKIYDDKDSRLALRDEGPAVGGICETATGALDSAALAQVGERLRWKYGHLAATVQRAKTSVTELRQHREETEAQAAPFVRRKVFASGMPSIRKLSAAEIGVAHHRFLERMSIEETCSADRLQREARQMQAETWLSEFEAAEINYDAVARFWQSALGRKISANRAAVHRELPFTAALSPGDIGELLAGSDGQLSAEEVVVVQGVVDLAVILPDEIWIVDFKTDTVEEEGLAPKVKAYEPQLQLYGLALSRIYRRPVTEQALYFICAGRMVSVAPCGATSL